MNSVVHALEGETCETCGARMTGVRVEYELAPMAWRVTWTCSSVFSVLLWDVHTFDLIMDRLAEVCRRAITRRAWRRAA